MLSCTVTHLRILLSVTSSLAVALSLKFGKAHILKVTVIVILTGGLTVMVTVRMIVILVVGLTVTLSIGMTILTVGLTG